MGAFHVSVMISSFSEGGRDPYKQVNQTCPVVRVDSHSVNYQICFPPTFVNLF